MITLSPLLSCQVNDQFPFWQQGQSQLTRRSMRKEEGKKDPCQKHQDSNGYSIRLINRKGLVFTVNKWQLADLKKPEGRLIL